MSQKEYDYNEIAQMLDDEQDELSNGHRLAEWLMKKNDYQPRRRRIFMDFVPKRVSLDLDAAQYKAPINREGPTSQQAEDVEDDVADEEVEKRIEDIIERVTPKDNKKATTTALSATPPSSSLDQLKRSGLVAKVRQIFKFSPNCFSTPNSALTRPICKIPQAAAAAATPPQAATTSTKASETYNVNQPLQQQSQPNGEAESGTEEPAAEVIIEDQEAEREEELDVNLSPETNQEQSILIRKTFEEMGTTDNDKKKLLSVLQLAVDKTTELCEKQNGNNQNTSMVNVTSDGAKRKLHFDKANKSPENLTLTQPKPAVVNNPTFVSNITITVNPGSQTPQDLVITNEQNVAQIQPPNTQDLLLAALEMLTPEKATDKNAEIEISDRPEVEVTHAEFPVKTKTPIKNSQREISKSPEDEENPAEIPSKPKNAMKKSLKEIPETQTFVISNNEDSRVKQSVARKTPILSSQDEIQQNHVEPTTKITTPPREGNCAGIQTATESHIKEVSKVNRKKLRGKRNSQELVLTDDEDAAETDSENNDPNCVQETNNNNSARPLNLASTLTKRQKQVLRSFRNAAPLNLHKNPQSDEQQRQPVTPRQKRSFKRNLNKAPRTPINGERFAKELKTNLARMTNNEIVDLRKRNSQGVILSSKIESLHLGEHLTQELKKRNMVIDESPPLLSPPAQFVGGSDDEQLDECLLPPIAESEVLMDPMGFRRLSPEIVPLPPLPTIIVTSPINVLPPPPPPPEFLPTPVFEETRELRVNVIDSAKKPVTTRNKITPKTKKKIQLHNSLKMAAKNCFDELVGEEKEACVTLLTETESEPNKTQCGRKRKAPSIASIKTTARNKPDTLNNIECILPVSQEEMVQQYLEVSKKLQTRNSTKRVRSKRSLFSNCTLDAMEITASDELPQPPTEFMDVNFKKPKTPPKKKTTKNKKNNKTSKKTAHEPVEVPTTTITESTTKSPTSLSTLDNENAENLDPNSSSLRRSKRPHVAVVDKRLLYYKEKLREFEEKSAQRKASISQRQSTFRTPLGPNGHKYTLNFLGDTAATSSNNHNNLTNLSRISMTEAAASSTLKSAVTPFDLEPVQEEILRSSTSAKADKKPARATKKQTKAAKKKGKAAKRLEEPIVVASGSEAVAVQSESEVQPVVEQKKKNKTLECSRINMSEAQFELVNSIFEQLKAVDKIAVQPVATEAAAPSPPPPREDVVSAELANQSSYVGKRLRVRVKKDANPLPKNEVNTRKTRTNNKRTRNKAKKQSKQQIAADKLAKEVLEGEQKEKEKAEELASEEAQAENEALENQVEVAREEQPTPQTTTLDNNNLELLAWLKGVSSPHFPNNNNDMYEELRCSSASKLLFSSLDGVDYAFYDTEDQSCLGYLRFMARQVKNSKRAKKYHLHFIVLSGEFKISTDKDVGNFASGDMVAIKIGARYKIENITDDIALLMVIKK